MDKKKIWIVFLLVVVIVIVVLFLLGLKYHHPNRSGFVDASTSSPISLYFRDQLKKLAVEDVGQPVDSGFNSQLLMEAFPGIETNDFSGVQTFGGQYQIENNKPVFVPNTNKVHSTADQMITKRGYATLLSNITARLDVTVNSNDDIDSLIAELDTSEHLQTKMNEGIGAYGIAIIPQKILEDSRCPSGVECIQAGTVKLSALVNTASSTQTMEFDLNQRVIVDGNAVTLETVLPESRSGETIKPDQYEFTFLIQKPMPETPESPNLGTGE